MKVLLINPNRFRRPVVPPIGLEFVSAYLDSIGHENRVLDLCFSEAPEEEISAVMRSFTPDLAGISVRNVDTVLFHTNEFFLDHIRDMVRSIKQERGIPVVAGGSGIKADPEGVLGYLGADSAVNGPAEGPLKDLLNDLSAGLRLKHVYGQHETGEIRCFRNSGSVNYGRYIAEGGIPGFETHKGCSSSCVYCIEANSPVRFRDIGSVISEISSLIDSGAGHFHLCDSEFNEDPDFTLEFLASLKSSSLPMKWTVYMKPGNFSQKMFRLMRDTGVYLITLTVDSFNKCPQYWADTEKMIFIARSLGIRTSVDLLTGFPREKEETIKWCIEFFSRLQPDAVNINTYIRLYRSLQITRLIMGDEALRRNLLGSVGDERLIRPVFYNHVRTETLEGLIGNDPLFRIEGPEQGVNYLR